MEILVTNKRDVVLEFFLVHPTREVHLRELARALRISFPWTRRLVSVLAKEGFLVRKKGHNLVLVKANRDYELFRALKRSYNLFALHKSGLVSHLVDIYGRPAAIVLFGSFSRGEDTESSDVDIAVVTKKGINADLSLFEKQLQRKIRITEISIEAMDSEFAITLANGIVLSGYLEVK